MDVNEILNYIESDAASFLDARNVTKINSQISSIRKKQQDKNLYLAVIGEFSSGKSTFINALLGFRLLKEAVTPTTACATFIQRKGKHLSIKVDFFSGEKFTASDQDNDIQKLATYLQEKHFKCFHDIHSIVEALTSDQSIAKTVKSLYIKVPNAIIPNNIIIIDTPGFNPGSDDVSNHSNITKYVVENVADAAIVLTPQEQAMSSTLICFLHNNLQRYLHRCTFVVTKMDVIEESYRKEILDFVKNRITHDFNLNAPRLYGLSAIAMLPVRRIPFGKEMEWPCLKSEFSQFENEMWTELQRSRLTVITEHVYSLTENVINQCVSHLTLKQKEIKDNKKFLEEHSIENIQSVCDKMMKAAQSVVDSSLYDLPISLSSAENNSRSFAESTINNGSMSLDIFKSKMMPSIKSKVESEAHNALSVINESINSRVKTVFTKQVNAMGKVFSSHYDSFPSLRPQQSPPLANVLKFNTPNMEFSIAISKINSLEVKQNEQQDTFGNIGAIAGGVVGFLLGGPFGAGVGALIGGGGGFIAGDKSKEMRSSAIPLVKDEISVYFLSLKEKIKQELSNIRSSYTKILKDFADAHVNTYGESICKLIEEHRNKIESLNLQIKKLNNTIRELQDLKDEIKKELAILRIKKH